MSAAARFALFSSIRRSMSHPVPMNSTEVTEFVMAVYREGSVAESQKYGLPKATAIIKSKPIKTYIFTLPVPAET